MKWDIWMMSSLGKIDLYDHQRRAVGQLRTGSILCGGVGSGKSLTAIAYYFENEYPKNLYIITTARKRDTLDWEKEAAYYDVTPKIVDSWNNIKKYIEISNGFFIFDEQRVIGSGVWVKSFLKIVQKNNWILLSATPGDTWMDYIPVFIANNFYKNRTHFIRRHVVFNRFLKFPKVDRYIEEEYLEKLKSRILVNMDYDKKTISHYEDVKVDYDQYRLKVVMHKRWDIYKDEPIRDAASMIFTARRVVNSDPSRFGIIKTLLEKHKKLIVFYNFNYELEILREFSRYSDIDVAEYNGHKHEEIPNSNSWIYLVQYMSGGEGWNCIETNVIVFYSLNYSYRMMTQAAGRIDRLNTPFVHLYYYRLVSGSNIDVAIKKALSKKKNFNERDFAKKKWVIMEGKE